MVLLLPKVQRKYWKLFDFQLLFAKKTWRRKVFENSFFEQIFSRLPSRTFSEKSMTVTAIGYELSPLEKRMSGNLAKNFKKWNENTRAVSFRSKSQKLNYRIFWYAFPKKRNSELYSSCNLNTTPTFSNWTQSKTDTISFKQKRRKRINKLIITRHMKNFSIKYPPE